MDLEAPFLTETPTENDSPAEAKAKLQAELGAYIDFQYNGELIPEIEYQELKAYLIKIRQEKTTGKQD